MAERELVITLRFAAEAAEQAAQGYNQRQRARVRELAADQERAEVEVTNNLKKNLNSRLASIRSSTQAALQIFKEYTETEKSLANASFANARELNKVKTNNQIMELARLSEAILDRYKSEYALASAAVSNSRELAKVETNTRIGELTRLSESIHERYKNEYILAAASSANARELARTDTNNRIVELTRLSEAIHERYKDEYSLQVASVANSRELAKVDTNSRIEELTRLSEAIQERYKSEGMQAATTTANSRELARLEARNRSDEMSKLGKDIEERYTREDRLASASSHNKKELSRLATLAQKRDLDDLGKAIRERYTTSTDEMTKGIEKVADSTGKAEKRAASFGMTIMAWHYGSRVINAVGYAIRTMNEDLRDATRHIESMVDHMESLREKSAEIIAMRGEKVTAGATAALARRAAQASVTVDEQIAGERAYQSYAQNLVQPEHLESPEFTKEELSGMAPQDRAAAIKEQTNFFARMSPQQETAFRKEQANYPISKKSSDLLSKKALQYAVSLGIRPDAAMKALSAIIRTSPRGQDGKVDVAEVWRHYIRVVGTLERMPGYASRLADEFTEVASEMSGKGSAIEDIEKMAVEFSVAGEINPERGSSLTRAGFRSIRQIMNDEEKMGELGINANMDYQVAMEKTLDSIEKMAAERHVKPEVVATRYFNQEHEFEFAMARRRAMKSGAMKRVESYQKGLTGKTGDQAISDYEKTNRAIDKRQKAELDLAQIEMGSEGEALRQFERQALINATKSGALKVPEGFWQAIRTKSAEQLGRGSKEEQFINEQTAHLLVTELENLSRGGHQEAADFLAGEGKLLIDRPDNTNGPLRERAANLIVKLKGSKPHMTAMKAQESARRTAFDRNPRLVRSMGFNSYEEFRSKASRDQLERLDVEANKVLAERGGVRPGNTTKTEKTTSLRQDSGIDEIPFLGNMMRYFFGPPRQMKGTNRPMTQAEIGEHMAHGVVNSQNRTPLRVVLPPALMASEAMGHMPGRASRHGRGHHHGFHPTTLAESYGMTRHAVPKGGEWYVDSMGRLRHPKRSGAMSLEDMRKAPVTWNVKPNARSLHAAPIKPNARPLGGKKVSGVAGAHEAMHHAPPPVAQSDPFEDFKRYKASGKDWQYYMRREQQHEFTDKYGGGVGGSAGGFASRDPATRNRAPLGISDEGGIAAAAKDLKAASRDLRSRLPAALPSNPRVATR